MGLRVQAAAGAIVFFGAVAMFSSNLRAVQWRTIGSGIAIQVLLAWLVLRGKFTWDGTEYSVYKALDGFGNIVKSFIGFTDKGSEFVFGNFARPDHLAPIFGEKFLFPFAFVALPTILFVSAFFTLLFHFGVLQAIVRAMSRVMVYLMGTSGAETLAVAANVFMGQTEAPLIVKPYIPRMTNSELFALMVSGMATVSGGMMAVYINYGADPVAILTTCVMACPCSLYLTKLMIPELGRPETAGTSTITSEKSPYVNAIDAISSGASDGLRLALNVAAMLIVFIAFIAMLDGILSVIDCKWLSAKTGWQLPEAITLQWVFGWLFTPVAFLMGIEAADQNQVGSLLGTKLVINEHMAYLQMKELKLVPDSMSQRSYQLVAFALTGFANFSSIGIQIGGIGALAPDRRQDLAKLGVRALYVGFIATLLNAAIAGLFL
jgi:concentrative nucleoside transporter, CNT family